MTAAREGGKRGEWGLSGTCSASWNGYYESMQAHRAETVLSEDGVLTLRNLPFLRGEPVEVIVLPFSGVGATGGASMPLRGTSVVLKQPTAPVDDAEWEVAG